MQSVLTFNLYEDIEQSIKLLLVYQKVLKSHNLENSKAYINNARKTSIIVLEKKSLIDATFL